MKLEFDPNAVALPLVENTDFDEMISDSNSPEVTKMLRDGIEAAQNGERAEARAILLRVTEADADNENAWLWLASISEYPEELLVFLKNVLSINANNERAIEWAKATESLMAKTFVQRGIDAAKNEQKGVAKQCFLQAIVHDRESEMAWLWLASVSNSPEEKMSHLQKVIRINPHNENAITSLKSAKMQMAKVLLPKANKLAIEGKREAAQKLLDEIVNDSPNFEDAWMLKAHLAESLDDKIGYFAQVYEINPNNQVAKANLDSLKMFTEDVALDEKPEFPEEAEKMELEVTEMETSEVDNSQEQDSSNESFDESAEVDTDEFELDSVQLEVEGENLEPEKIELEDESSPIADQELTGVEELAAEQTFETEAEEEEVVPDQPLETEESFEGYGEDLMATEPVDEFVQDSDAVDHFEESQAIEESVVEEEISFDEAAVEYEDAEYSNNEAETAEERSEEYIFERDDSQEDEEVESSNEMTAKSDSKQEPVKDFEIEAGDAESAPFEQADQETDDDLESMYFDEKATEFESPESIKEEPIEEEPTEKESVVEMVMCSFCESNNDPQAFSCGECKSVLSLSDIEMLLSQEDADDQVIKETLKKLEADRETVGVSAEELMTLGIGYINLKVFRKGFEYLQEAAHKDQNNVILGSQIDALAIRINEIEEQEKDFDAQPKSKTILVVDDSPTVRKLISGKLEKSGHDAICAVDGMDALSKLNEIIPDLILLDITMPRMDGYQVCKLIRGNDATKDVPVVMISGKDGFFDKVRGKMAGTDNYITKPFGPETLMKTVNEYISE